MDEATNILKRLAFILGTSSYQEMADRLGVSKSTVGNWHHRGSVPFEECIRVAMERGVSLDWLFVGRGKPYLRDAPEPSSLEPDADLRSLARLSSMAQVFQVLCMLERAPATEREVVERTGLEPDLVRGCLLLLAREKLAVVEAGWWRHLANADILKSRDSADVSAHAMAATEFLTRDVIQRVGESDVVLSTADVCIVGPMASRRLMAALMGAADGIAVDQNGVVLRVVIGIAPPGEAG